MWPILKGLRVPLRYEHTSENVLFLVQALVQKARLLAELSSNMW